MRRTHRRSAPIVAVAWLLGAALVGSGAMTLAPGSARADDAGWGPAGTVTTSSAATVRWDNTGNSAVNSVARDASQTLPLTGGKTYADVPSDISAGYAQDFGEDNGLGGLSVTVSQTTNLVSQAVTLDVSGLPGYANGDAPQKYLQVFQCWGAPGAKGTVDRSATSPDPRTCQTGVGGGDLGSGTAPDLRSLAGDPLGAAGSLAKASTMPFLPIGSATAVGAGEITQYFSRATTNELSDVTGSAAGTASRTFEMQTTREASDLGCGYRSGTSSTRSCWLVVVPVDRDLIASYNFGETGTPSGLTPSLWAQRLQVELGFQDIAPECADGQARALAAGSELATAAMASWIPALCDRKKVASGYTELTDDQARSQLATAGFSFVSEPAPATTKAVYAPTALTGVVIGSTVDYYPCGSGTTASTAQIVENCGYSSEDQARTEIAKAGTQVQLRLDARLVAKLLTQSYAVQLPAQTDFVSKAPFLGDQSFTLANDPEFEALNPQLAHQYWFNAPTRLEVEGLKSDAAAALWRWVVNDPAAKSFLDGCPDPAGHTVNVWYSTRSYAECTSRRAGLEKAAKAVRAATTTPAGFNRDVPPTYPPEGAAFPQVLYAQSDATCSASFQVKGKCTAAAETDDVGYQGPMTLIDQFPPYANQAATALTALRAAPTRGTWCNTYLGGCNPARWATVNNRQPVGQRATLVVTDTANAARYKLQTAALCNDGGSECVSATAQSITTAVARFVAGGTDGVLTAPKTPDYAGGAYPLSMIVYGAVGTTGLTRAAARADADILDFVTTTGQTPGLAPGNLLPGYVPITTALSAQAKKAVAALRKVTDAPAGATPTTAPGKDTDGSGSGGAGSGSGGDGSGGDGAASAGDAHGAKSAASAPATAAAEAGTVATAAVTPHTDAGPARLAVIGGLVAALAAGAAAPVVGRKRRADR